MPPLTAVAVKVTLVPGHIAPVGFAEMLILAATEVFTVILIAVEVAGEPVTQLKVDVITQFIASAVTSDDEV